MVKTDDLYGAGENQSWRETIFALSSGSGKAGVSIFRVSGPKTQEIVKAITGMERARPRYMHLKTFKDKNGRPIDKGLVVAFQGPKSFTGEDFAEFHSHGSQAVIEAMSQAFVDAGARQAEPGEFTRRAFDNGKMDLTEAEGLADLIDAETEGQREQAFRQMDGGLRQIYETWRQGLIDALAAIEGDIDFPDEQDVPDDLSHAAYEPITNVLMDMKRLLDDSGRARSIRRGIHIAIIGPPNAGKSTLLNRLAGREAAIVSNVAGTTRDVIDVQMSVAGLPVTFSDTAGLRETDNEIEAEGVRRAMLSSQQADMRIGVISKDEGGMDEIAPVLQKDDIIVLNKADLGLNNMKTGDLNIIPVSALSGFGFETFYDHLAERIKLKFGGRENAGLTRARHRDCIEKAVEALNMARVSLKAAPELAGDDVRSALHAIKELAGEADIEAVLGAIFSRFCIGK